MSGFELAALIIATVSIGTILGAAVGYYSAARTFEQERENLIDAIDAAMFKVAADKRPNPFRAPTREEIERIRKKVKAYMEEERDKEDA